jgi:hypothetical protein
MQRLHARPSWLEKSVVPLKLLSLGFLLVMAPWAWLFPVAFETECLIREGQWALLAAYLPAVATCFAGLFILPFLGNWNVRTGLTIVLLSGFLADQVMVSISGQHMTLETMRTLWRERDMASDAMSVYLSALAVKGSLTVLPAFFFLAPPGTRRALQTSLGLVPLAALLGVTALIQTSGDRIGGFPAPYSAPAQFALTTLLPDPNEAVPRSPVEYTGELQRGVEKIVMIVDESVRGDMLGLNNPRYDNTPVLKEAGGTIINYGIAIAAGNCSAASRAIMRLGVESRRLPDPAGIWRHIPTIWQYAHKAGYKTVLIDTWKRLHSHMDEQEFAMIDTFLRVTDEPEYTRVTVVADHLIELLGHSEPLLIYVNNQGIHPPYSARFPPDLAYDPEPLVRDLELADWRRDSVRDYHKALRWSVDGFFAKLLPVLQTREDVVLIYTSDHGQSLYEGGYDLSHCSVRPDLALGEVLVPLFVITGSRQLAPRFEAEARRAFNRADHFEIFPTLLELMGYSSDWVEEHYGPGLLDVPTDRRRGFLVGSVNNPRAVWTAAD